MRYRVDRRVERRDGGRVLIGGDPTTLLRLSAAGAAVLDRWSIDGADRTAASPSEIALIGRLVAAGMMHPAPDPSDAPALPDPVVIVPVRDRVAALDRCLTALVASGATDVVVVDDGSSDAAAHRMVAERHGATLVRRDASGGPAAARMAGWSAVRARPVVPDFVAFVDSDIDVTLDRWAALLGHFADRECGLVAPRVVHRAGVSLADRYEVANSPLDLGPDPAPIVAGSRVSYVPAAALVVRASAFDAVGGFDASLEVGEDVDLLWRLADAGWRCRYEPAAEVAHVGRSALGPMLRRRFDYGRSAAALDVRHPGALPPVRGSRWSAAVVTIAASGHPVMASGVAAWTVKEMAGKLGNVPDAPRLATRLVLRGHFGFARQVARALVRPWWPITLLAVLVSRRVRRLAPCAVLVAPVLAWRERRPEISLPGWVALWLADDLAYATGVWVGCVRHRSWGALRPG